MVAGTVLILHEDEWQATVLAKSLRDEGWTAVHETTARGGFERAKALAPDCIVCDMELPDIDGLWVARRVRTEDSAINAVPIVFLTRANAPEERLQGFNVGASVCISKPYRSEDIVAQIKALVDVATRNRHNDSYGPPSQTVSPALRGDIAQMSISTLLTLLDLERRSGFLKVRSPAPSTTVVFELAEGAVAHAAVDDVATAPVDALRRVLRFQEGRFWFRPDERGRRRPADASVSALLLDATRLEDEAGHGG
jgi:DNA-binding response OmpR family regulator